MPFHAHKEPTSQEVFEGVLSELANFQLIFDRACETWTKEGINQDDMMQVLGLIARDATRPAITRRVLQEWLKEAPVVYGYFSKCHEGDFTAWCRQKNGLRVDDSKDTHTAGLVDIREIKSGL